MSGYSPKSNTQLDATLAPGYTPPAGLQNNVVLAPGTEYEYRPSPNYNVSATLAPGYTPPAGLANNATLSRTGGGSEPGQITLPGLAYTQFGTPTVTAAPGAGLTQFMFLLAQ